MPTWISDPGQSGLLSRRRLVRQAVALGLTVPTPQIVRAQNGVSTRTSWRKQFLYINCYGTSGTIERVVNVFIHAYHVGNKQGARGLRQALGVTRIVVPGLDQHLYYDVESDQGDEGFNGSGFWVSPGRRLGLLIPCAPRYRRRVRIFVAVLEATPAWWTEYRTLRQPNRWIWPRQIRSGLPQDLM